MAHTGPRMYTNGKLLVPFFAACAQQYEILDTEGEVLCAVFVGEADKLLKELNNLRDYAKTLQLKLTEMTKEKEALQSTVNLREAELHELLSNDHHDSQEN